MESMQSLGGKFHGDKFCEIMYIDTLEYYDIPLLWYGTDGTDSWLVYWCDADDNHERWLYVKVINGTFNLLKSKDITMREALFGRSVDRQYFLVDLCLKTGAEQVFCFDISNTPYGPEPECYL